MMARAHLGGSTALPPPKVGWHFMHYLTRTHAPNSYSYGSKMFTNVPYGFSTHAHTRQIKMKEQ